MFLGMLLYLGVSGLLLILLAYYATKNLVRANSERIALSQTERTIMGGRVQGVQTYANEQRSRIVLACKTLDVIDGVLGDRIDLAPILLGLASPLSSGTSFLSLDLDASSRNLTFELLVPVGAASENPGATGFLNVWNSDPVLMSRVGSIAPGSSHRLTIESGPASVLKFSCVIRKEP